MSGGKTLPTAMKSPKATKPPKVPKALKATLYSKVLAHIFVEEFSKDTTVSEFMFKRTALTEAAAIVGVKLPKNLGDVVYSHRYRTDPPAEISQHEPQGKEWVIFGAGKGLYRFVLVKKVRIVPNPARAHIKIPDSTPEIIRQYKMGDEQALLAKIRYNRLIDMFLGLVTYPLQSHLRTSIEGVGQIEVDELYVGVDRRGAHYVIPIQAKGIEDRLGIVQVWQDTQYCAASDKFGGLIGRCVGAQALDKDTNIIALFEFRMDGYNLSLLDERIFELVPHASLSASELETYKRDALMAESRIA